LRQLERRLARHGLKSVRYSELREREREEEVLVVDERGFLAEIYGLGCLAYVGGGYGRHIHSIIEPIAHRLPVAFGPRHHRSPEAITLKATGTARALGWRGGESELAQWIERMAGEGEERTRAVESLKVFLQIHRGAGAREADFVLAQLRLGPAGNGYSER
jgi:3-deoxy-D-manno-octulosonic-acid transferase